MKVAILGLWHLGSVTCACMARHHQVIGIDPDESTVAALRTGRATVREPGLDELLAAGIAARQLAFSANTADVRDADLLWVCFDTPVDADDRSDVSWVHERLSPALPHLKAGTVVLISSQLPVGTCATLGAKHPKLVFACSPENLRLGKALDAFEHPARIVVGAEAVARPLLETLLAPLRAPLLWMRTESAEMLKHALNSFLALSVAYINEVAVLAEPCGADAGEVAAGLKSDPRIGPKAYLSPGGPFAGGTLARDVVTLSRIGADHDLDLALIPSIKTSNDRHRQWAFRKAQTVLAGVAMPVVAVLGLAYTPNTNTLRRSAAVELCRQLLAAGMTVRAFDPLIRSGDADHQDIPFASSIAETMRGAHAVILCTDWPELRNYPWADLLASMRQPVVIDANRLVENAVVSRPNVAYHTVGRS